MKSKMVYFTLFALALCFASCEKGPGEGGTSTIRGKVIIREYNGSYTILRGEYPATKEDVFIVYGDDEVYGDNFETGYDGIYEFNYLREGSYTIYAYSDDSTDLITSRQVAVMRHVEITGKDQIIEVPDIIILK